MRESRVHLCTVDRKGNNPTFQKRRGEFGSYKSRPKTTLTSDRHGTGGSPLLRTTNNPFEDANMILYRPGGDVKVS